MSALPLEWRLPLERLAPGRYVTEDGAFRVSESEPSVWVVVPRRSDVPLAFPGRQVEFTTLREARGALADQLEAAAERRAA